jgi:hypothetical protein
MESETTPAVAEGYAQTKNVKLPGGRVIEVPWGFSDKKKEAAAAKKHGVENPETSKPVE